MSRRPNRNALASPVVIGAITVLVLLIGVGFAYTANVGLPFVPVRTLHVDIADGTDLTRSNDVLEGGYRIGYVKSLKSIVLPNGAPGAQLTLALSTNLGRLPVDSTATVLQRSPIGLKYVGITRGHSSRMFADGATMPATQTSVPVQYYQLLSQYDPATRRAVQDTLNGSGNLLAGRGSALNDTLATLPRLLGHLTPVAGYLADPRTNLTGFFQAIDHLTGTLAPVSQSTVNFFANMATTWQALSLHPAALEATIARSPSTLGVGTRSLIDQRPLLASLTAFGNDISPAARELDRALPAVNATIAAGSRSLGRTPPLDARLQGTLTALERLAQAPTTGVAVNALSDTVNTLNPAIRYLGPYVTVCNDWNYWFTNLAGDVDETTNFGFAQRALSNQANSNQPNGLTQAGASQPVNGGVPDSNVLGGNAYAHGPTYGAAVDAQGNADCETGQRGYPHKLNAFDPQGRNFDTDQHTPGNQGATYAGRAHVPAGETFVRAPQTSPVLPLPSTNP